MAISRPSRFAVMAWFIACLAGTPQVASLESWVSCSDNGGGAGKEVAECEAVKSVPDQTAWHLMHAIANGQHKKAKSLMDDFTPGPNSKPFPTLRSVFGDMPVDLHLPDANLGFFGQERYFWRGATPLMLASAFAQPRVVQMLLKRRADRTITFGTHAKVPVAKGWTAVDMVGKALLGCETSSPSLQEDEVKPYSPSDLITCEKRKRIEQTYALLTGGLSEELKEDDEL